ncbi:hypothetical protein PLICRDRAFT_155080 [Plicaturopsis crispa FD-325 SS-3]|nr:hypothetical protein PLICRDRAFT_155080 [Plicaturopsis crispa FD-325 SS-3]
MVVSTQPDRRLLWHPRHDNKFIVGGGSQITLYEWAPDYPEIRHITSRLDLQFMKCFAWSPDPNLDDLMAVGLSTGRVDLIRLEANKSTHNHVLSNGPVVSLPVRNSRSCNALAFCAADPNYLAVGLDKVRGDPSLIIWDVNTASASLAHSLSPGEHTTVYPRPTPQIPRADISSRADSRILQHHAPTEVVSSVTFLPRSTYHLLAGISHRWLRLFDLRSPVPSNKNIATKVHGIATDPFDTHRIATFGDSVVTVWDIRYLSAPLLTFTEMDAAADGARNSDSAVTTVEFSSTRRGALAALQRDSTYVRFWDIQQSQTLESSGDGEKSQNSSQSVRTQRRSWANLPWTSGNQSTQGEQRAPPSNLVLSDTYKTKYFNRPLASFALVPGLEAHSLTSKAMIVNKDGDLELYAVHDTPKQAVWSARGDLALGAGKTCRIVPGFHETSPPNEPWNISPSRGAIDRTLSHHERERSPMNEAGGFNTLPPIFGRGDEDGFPALTANVTHAPANLAATRPGHVQSHSPASFRSYHFEHSSAVPEVGTGSGSTADKAAHTNGINKERSHRGRHRDKSASRGRKQNLKLIQHVVEEDISMVMRQRVVRGYGLASPRQNIRITQGNPSDSLVLSELWGWITHSRELLSYPSPRLHGYDFSFKGLHGIWEGFQCTTVQDSTMPTPRNFLLQLPPDGIERRSSSARPRNSKRRDRSPIADIHGDFHAAILALGARGGHERTSWKPSVSTAKLAQRRFALQLLGWSLSDGDLNEAVAKWEKEGKYSQAACWLVFTKQYSKAIELLMHSGDESHHMMSGTLTALTLGPSKNSELRAHCERLIVRLQDPYFRAMLTQLTSSDWSEVLEEESLPLRERLAIAFQFLEDKDISSYLRRIIDSSCTQGDIEGIIVTGLTPSGMNILQSYVNRTGDVQSATLLSSYVCPVHFEDARAQRWLDAYRDLLDGFKLFHHRVSFDVERGQLLHAAVESGDVQPFKWAPPQILLRCNYCNKAFNVPGSVDQTEHAIASRCPNCDRSLPRCSICLMPLGILHDTARDADLAHSQLKDTIEDAIVMCQSCRHGGHASHMMDWFFGDDGNRPNTVCAVADCNCSCADEL